MRLLLEYVTNRVIDFSSRLGKTQRPTVRGKLDGDISWPVFTPGELYRAAFPELIRQTVVGDIQSRNCSLTRMLSEGFFSCQV